MIDRCRLCTANGVDGVVEHVAEQLWESRRHGSPDDVPWSEAGGYWQTIYRELAATAVGSLQGVTAADLTFRQDSVGRTSPRGEGKTTIPGGTNVEPTDAVRI